MIGLVWAQAANGVIGRDGKLPWYLPEDLAHFKSLTGTATVVMGRKTWESLPDRYRPLPGRRNLVVSHRKDAVFPGAETAESLAAVLQAPPDEPIWVIGGATIYAASLDYADQVVITELEKPFDGDTYAPSLGPAWKISEDSLETGWRTSKIGLRFRINCYVRNAPRP